MLHVEQLSLKRGDFALREISFEVSAGDYFVLLGSSGAGKTLLLEALAGLVRTRAGRIRWNSEDVTRTPIQHRGFALVYQRQALFPHLTVYANIAYGLRARGLPRREVDARVRTLAAETGAGALLGRMPGNLSGGEAQRVALARALAVKPRCLLLDEPLASLDTQARGEMRGLLRALNRRGHTVIHVTHDYEEAVALASHVGIMENGRIVQAGGAREVFQHPASEFAARFIGIRNVYRGRLLPSEAGGTPRFEMGETRFPVLTDARPGPGFLVVRSEDVFVSNDKTDTSARNVLRGAVAGVTPARLGVEVEVDAGVPVTAWVTRESAAHLELRPGKTVWVSFKASAALFIEERPHVRLPTPRALPAPADDRQETP